MAVLNYDQTVSLLSNENQDCRNIYQDYVSNLFSSSEFIIPTLGGLVPSSEGESNWTSALWQEFANTYGEGAEYIDIRLATLQGFLLNGVVMAFMPDGGSGLFTANAELIEQLKKTSKTPSLNTKALKKAIDEGMLYGRRIRLTAKGGDIEALIGNADSGIINYYLIPFALSRVLLSRFEEEVRKGVLKVQSEGRDFYISTGFVIKDNGSIVRRGVCEINPRLTNLLVYPTLAADSFGEQRVRLDLAMGVDSIQRCQPAEVKEAMQKGDIPTLGLGEVCICQALARLDRFNDVMKHQDDKGYDVPSLGSFIAQYEVASREVLANEANTRLMNSNVRELVANYSSGEVLDPYLSPEDLKAALQKGVVYIQASHKGSDKVQELFGTNNEDLLKRFYGEDYIAKYESEGVQIRRALQALGKGEDLHYIAQNYFPRILEFTNSSDVVGDLEDKLANMKSYSKDSTVSFRNILLPDHNNMDLLKRDFYCSVRNNGLYYVEVLFTA